MSEYQDKYRKDWAEAQLDAAGIVPTAGWLQQVTRTSVLRLLDTFWQQNHDDETRKSTLETFTRLAYGHSMIEEPPTEVVENWVPLQAGMFRKGDPVRVKADAFDGERGMIHNGRRGVIVDVRRGDVIFNSRDEKTPEIVSEHYRPEHLEGLVS